MIVEFPTLELEILNNDGHSALWLALEEMRHGTSIFAAKLIEKGSSPDAIDWKSGRLLLIIGPKSIVYHMLIY